MSQWKKGQPLKGGQYIVEDLIGFGGFGVTYRATEQPSGKLVAIKTLNALQQSKPDFEEIQEKFINEAMCLARCSHRHADNTKLNILLKIWAMGSAWKWLQFPVGRF